jgi:hypothetical protein
MKRRHGVRLALLAVLLMSFLECSRAPVAQNGMQQQPAARRLSSSILPNSIPVEQDHEVQFKFIIPEGAHDARLDGEYKINPIPYAQMDVYVVPERVLNRFSDAAPDELLYHSGFIQADSIHLRISPGTYYFVFANRAPADSTNSYDMPSAQRVVWAKMNVSF